MNNKGSNNSGSRIMDSSRFNNVGSGVTTNTNPVTNRQHLYPGAFRAQLWGRNNTAFTGTNTMGMLTQPLATTFTRDEPEAPSLSLGERVVWVRDLGPEIGTVRWIGRLPVISPDWSVGVEFDNPISTGNGKFGTKQYFITKANHAVFLPIMALLRAQDYDGDHPARTLKESVQKPGSLQVFQECRQHSNSNCSRRASWESSCGDPGNPHYNHQHRHCCHCHNCESEFVPAGPGTFEDTACGHCKVPCNHGTCGSASESQCGGGFVTSTPRNATRHKSVTIKETLGGPGFDDWSDEDLKKFPFKSWTSSSRQSVVSCPATVGPRTILIAKKLSSDSSDTDCKNGKFKTLMSCFLPGQAYRSKKRKKKKRQKYILAQEQKQVAYLTARDGDKRVSDSGNGPWTHQHQPQQCDMHRNMSCSLHAMHNSELCPNHGQTIKRNLSYSGTGESSNCCNDIKMSQHKCSQTPSTAEPVRKKKPPPPIPVSAKSADASSSQLGVGSASNVSNLSKQNARDRFFLDGNSSSGVPPTTRTSSFNNYERKPENKLGIPVQNQNSQRQEPAMRSRRQPASAGGDMSKIISQFTYVGNSGRSQSLFALTNNTLNPAEPKAREDAQLKVPNTSVTISPHPRRSNKSKRAPQPPNPGSSLSLFSTTAEEQTTSTSANKAILPVRSESLTGITSLQGSQGQPKRENVPKKRMAPVPPALPKKTVAHDTMTLFGYLPREGTLSRSSSELEYRPPEESSSLIPAKESKTEKSEDQLLDDLIAEMNSLSKDISEMRRTNSFQDGSIEREQTLNLISSASNNTAVGNKIDRQKDEIYKEKGNIFNSREKGHQSHAKIEERETSLHEKAGKPSKPSKPSENSSDSGKSLLGNISVRDNQKDKKLLDGENQEKIYSGEKKDTKINNLEYKDKKKDTERSVTTLTSSSQTSPEKINKKKNKKKKKAQGEGDTIASVDEVTEILCEIEQVVKSKPTVQDFVAAFTKFTEKAEQIAANHSSTVEATPKKTSIVKMKASTKDDSGKFLKSFPTKWLFNTKSDKKKDRDGTDRCNASNSLDRAKQHRRQNDSEEDKVKTKPELDKFGTFPRGLKTRGTLINDAEVQTENLISQDSLKDNHGISKPGSTESMNIKVETSPVSIKVSIPTEDMNAPGTWRTPLGNADCSGTQARRLKTDRLADILETQDSSRDLNQQPNQTQFFQNRDILRRLSIENRKMRHGSTSSLNNVILEEDDRNTGVIRKSLTPNSSPILNRAKCAGKPPLPYKHLADHPLEVENRLLFAQLEGAIARGQHGRAAALARELALQKTTGSLSRLKRHDDSQEDKTITVCLFIEDKKSHKGPIPLNVTTSMTVKALKEKIEKDMEFPYDSQRWILGKSFVTNDMSTLGSLDICIPGCPVFLYIVTPEKKEVLQNHTLNRKSDNNEVEVKLTALKNRNMEEVNSVERTDYKRDEMKVEIKEEKIDEILTPKREEPVLLEFGLPLNETATLIDSESSQEDERFEEVEEPEEEEDETAEEEENETVEEEENEMFETDKLSTESEENNEEQKQNYHELVQLEEQDLIVISESFECSICFTDVEIGAGVVLRECLHSFCKDCLSKAVEYSEEAVIKCPFRNQEYSCDSHLLEREIKALVPPELFDKHLARSVTVAESRAQNSFHCKSPDCPGWCLFEDNVNIFPCPVCGLENCLTCGAAHPGKNCRQYQDELEFEAALSEDAKKTKELLDKMVKDGQATHCPTCRVIVMKKWGCDWVKCSVCQTEICWVTKGPRWGPAGRGDTSAGCRCGVNGVKCHQKCNYCH